MEPPEAASGRGGATRQRRSRRTAPGGARRPPGAASGPGSDNRHGEACQTGRRGIKPRPQAGAFGKGLDPAHPIRRAEGVGTKGVPTDIDALQDVEQRAWIGEQHGEEASHRPAKDGPQRRRTRQPSGPENRQRGTAARRHPEVTKPPIDAGSTPATTKRGQLQQLAQRTPAGCASAADRAACTATSAGARAVERTTERVSLVQI